MLLHGSRPVGPPAMGLLRTMQLTMGHANTSRRLWRPMGSESLVAARERSRADQRHGIFLTEADFNHMQLN